MFPDFRAKRHGALSVKHAFLALTYFVIWSEVIRVARDCNRKALRRHNELCFRYTQS